MTLAKLESDLRRNPLFFYPLPRQMFLAGVFFICLFLGFTVWHVLSRDLESFLISQLVANVSMFIGVFAFFVSFYKAWKLSLKV